MAKKLYLILSGAVFFVVAMGHLLRLVVHWPIVVGPWTIPFALSYVGLIASAGLCVWAFGLLFSRETRGGRDNDV